MSQDRKIVAILAADIVGFSRLTSTDEDRTLARLRALRSDVLDPTIAVHRGRIVKRTGDGVIVEFRSVVNAVACALDIQGEMAQRNAGVALDRSIRIRIGVHLGDVVEEADGDLMGDGVNIATRLEGIADPGAICLSEDAFRQVKARLSVGYKDLGFKTLKNISEPVRVYSLESEEASRNASSLQLQEKNSTPPLSVAVLPFSNLSPQANHDYFSDALVDGLTTDLSRHVPNLFVTAARSAYTYKSSNTNFSQIGRELGVRYILTGSVQQGGSTIRVNAQLLNAETGMQLWAERFDGEPTDLLALQDQITGRLANSLGLALLIDRTKAIDAQMQNPDAADLTMRGWAAFFLGDRTLENFRTAEPYYRQALAIDPNHSDALIGLGAVIAGRLFNFGLYELSSEQLRNQIAEANGLLDRGLTAKPNSAAAHAAKGILLACQQRWREALPFISTAHSLDPSSALFALNLGNTLSSLGRPAEAVVRFHEGIRRSPRDPSMGLLQLSLGRAHLLLGDWDAAIEACLNARSKVPTMFLVHVSLAAAYAHLGQMENAQLALADAILVEPKLSLDWFKEHPYSTEPAYLKLAEATLYAGLQLAGLRKIA